MQATAQALIRFFRHPVVYFGSTAFQSADGVLEYIFRLLCFFSFFFRFSNVLL
jgi:hypothetical protein